MSRALSLDIQTTPTNTYPGTDPTVTVLAGRATQKNNFNGVSGLSVVGGPQNMFLDVFTDSGLVPIATAFGSGGQHIFVLCGSTAGTITGGLAQILVYNFDTTAASPTPSYVGRVNISMPNTAATTHTIRGFKVYSPGTSGWKIFIATTGSVAINGGVFMVNNMAASDFVPAGFPTIPFATGSNQKAVYQLQDSTLHGAAHVQTAGFGVGLDVNSNSITLANGTVTTNWQLYKYDYTATPDNPGQTFTITIASPGVVTATAHGYNNNDPVVLSTTGALPTGLVAGTNYFVRNPTANTFELSATSGGASINTTGAQSGIHTVRRSFGQTGTVTLVKTGNLTALTGAQVASHNLEFGNPTASNFINNGFDCYFICTATNLYNFRATDVVASATTLPTLVTVNNNGQSSMYIPITPTNFNYSASLDRYMMFNNGRFILKQHMANTFDLVIGATRITQLVGQTGVVPPLGAVTMNGADIRNGWLAFNSITVGQQGVIICDVKSDALFDETIIYSKVLDVPSTSFLSLDLEFNYPNTRNFFIVYYRTSGFTSPTGGWTLLNDWRDMSTVANPTGKIQFKFLSNLGTDPSGRLPQLGNAYLVHQPLSEMSDNWEISFDQTTSGSPTRVGFRLKKAYPSAVPSTLTFRAYDTSDALLATDNITGSPLKFQYSTDDGLSYNPLGTIPNVVGTIVQYTFTSPPGVRIRPSLRDS